MIIIKGEGENLITICGDIENVVYGSDITFLVDDKAVVHALFDGDNWIFSVSTSVPFVIQPGFVALRTDVKCIVWEEDGSKTFCGEFELEEGFQKRTFDFICQTLDQFGPDEAKHRIKLFLSGRF